ncbi:hypothetical protein RUM43_013898 [Polyplax serrata]|uniref:SMB domain-containing protein n=1 Tax=Polyplax serrata TaxID=468196 RepID=A0AAN8PRD9_POLSC
MTAYDYHPVKIDCTYCLFEPKREPQTKIKTHLHGTLKVFVKPENLELYNIIPTFWVNGNQGNKWIQGFVPIERTEFPFQIVLEGIRGSGYVSDTAFDDVKIAFGTECAMLEALTSTESTTSVGEFEDQDEENIYFSCRNRCNQTLSSIDKESERNCDCQEECVQAKTCCSDFFDFCQFTDSTTEWLSSSTVDSSGLSYSEPKVSGDKTNDTVDSQKPPKTAFNENPKTNATNTQDAAKVKIITIPVIDAEKEEPPQVTNSTAKVIGIPIIKTEEEVKPQVKNLTVKINEVPIIRGEKVVTKSEVNNSTNQANVTIPTRVVQNKTDVEKKFQLKSNVTKPANSVVNSTNDASKISPERNVTMQKINKTLKGTQPLENSIPVKPLKPPSSSTAAAAAPRKFVKNSKPVESINTVFREKVSVPVFPNELRFHKGKPKEFSGKENPQAIKIDKKEEVREGDFRGIIEAAGICLVVSVVLIILGVVWYRRSRSRKSERDGMVEDSDVRFLTSDEVLDFTLARPSDDDL